MDDKGPRSDETPGIYYVNRKFELQQKNIYDIIELDKMLSIIAE